MRASTVFLKVDEAIDVGIEVGVLFLRIQPVKSLPIIAHAIPVAVEALHQVVRAEAAGPRPPVCQRGNAGLEIHRLPRRAPVHPPQPADAGEFVAGELPRVAVHNERILGVKVVGIDIGQLPAPAPRPVPLVDQPKVVPGQRCVGRPQINHVVGAEPVGDERVGQVVDRVVDERVVGLPRGALINLTGRGERRLLANHVGRAARTVSATEKVVKIFNSLGLVPAGVGVVVVAAPERRAHRFLAPGHLNLVHDAEGRAAVALAGVHPVGVPKSALGQVVTAEQARRGTGLAGGQLRDVHRGDEIVEVHRVHHAVQVEIDEEILDTVGDVQLPVRHGEPGLEHVGEGAVGREEALESGAVD